MAHSVAAIAGMLKQRTQPVALPICTVQSIVLSSCLTIEFSGQFCLILVPRQWAVLAVEPVLWLCPGREANSQVHPAAEYGTWLGRLISESGQLWSPSHRCAWARNQASSPIQLFPTSGTTKHRSQAVALPKKIPCSKFHLPKDATRWLVQNLSKLRRTASAEAIMSNLEEEPAYSNMQTAIQGIKNHEESGKCDTIKEPN